MSDSPESAFAIKIAYSVAEIGQSEWNVLSGDRPFQSFRWYTYGERCMADCPPFYIILTLNNQAIARGTFWLVRDEPLPVNPPLRTLVQAAFHRWPLLICRSPLSGLSGLILPDPPLRDEALRRIAEEAKKEARRCHVSFLIFDFMEAEQTHLPGWPKGFAVMDVADPGTQMCLEWSTFQDYLASRDKKNQRRYQYNTKKAAELSIKVTKHRSVHHLEEALTMIHMVEDKYQSMHNPWICGMLENMQMVDSTFLEAHIGTQLVGCELLLYDNGAQIPTALGHIESVPYAYFEMLYTNIQDAFERSIRLLRWGSGSYDIKRHLGFQLEQNNHAVFAGIGSGSRLAAKLAG